MATNNSSVFVPLGNFVSRDQYKNKKAMEEARKAGTIPAAKDEDGNEINPHMPLYISAVPCKITFFNDP